jgi:Zn finger protein HypA/HybF involved in hydrogenase expression
MHGLSAADAVLHKVLSESERNPGRRVLEVKVKVGRFMFADMEEFTSAWQLIIQDTPLAGAKLTLDVVDGRDCILEAVVFD